MGACASYFEEASKAFADSAPLAAAVDLASAACIAAISAGGKVMACGNGGSAAQCQHFAAELVGRYKLERAPWAAIALTTDSSNLTAIGNDYGFDTVFERQVRGLGRKGDVLLCLSTSGNSPNVLKAIAACREMGIATIGLTGGRGGRMASECDIPIIVPSGNTPRIQEVHLAIIHAICHDAETALAGKQ